MPLRPFFENGYGSVLSASQPFEYCYECSSATVYRTFRMSVYPTTEGDGCLVVNSLTVERAHSQEITAFDAN